MAELQTNYLNEPVIGIVGAVANGETSNRISRTISDAGGIAFGRAAFRGANDHTITATPTAGALLGITLATTGLGIIAGQTADVYAQYENVPVMTLGAVFVLAGEAVLRGDQAYVTPAGAINKTVAGNTILPGWFFDTAAASGGVAILVRR